MTLSRPCRTLGAVALAAVIAGAAGCSRQQPADLLEAGRTALQAQDPKAAVIHLKSAAQLDPDSPEVRYQLGRALLATGDPSGAAVELTRAFDLSYERDKVIPELARALLLTGATRKLVDQFGQVQLGSGDAQAALKSTVATAWATLGDRAKTEAAIRAALEASPNHRPARVLLARLQAGQGDFSGALAVVDKILAEDPKQYEAWHLKGEILAVTSGKLEDAEGAFRRSIEAEPGFVPAHAALIASHIRRNDIAGAKARLDTLREKLPQHPQVLFSAAQIAYVDKDYAKAREITQQLLRGVSDHAGLLLLAAAVEWQGGSLSLSQRYLTRALQLEPTMSDVRRNLAQIQIRLGQPAQALVTLQPLLASGKADSAALGAAGEASLALGDSRTAEAMFAQAARASPDNPQVLTALALARLARGDANPAFEQLESISARSKDTTADFALVSARLRRNEFDLALSAADAMVRKDPENPTLQELLGRVHWARRDLAAARAALEKALRKDPSLFSATLTLGAVDEAEGNPQRAVQRLQAIIAADPRHVAAMVALADLKVRQRAPAAEVQQLLQDAIKAAPEEYAARVRLVDMLRARKQFREALVVAQEAAAALPTDVNVLDALGLAQLDAGESEQALATFRRITGIDPSLASPHFRIAQQQRVAGNRSAAAASYRRALELDPEYKAARVALVDLLVEDKRSRDALSLARDLQARAPDSPGGYLLEANVHRRLRDDAGAVPVYRLGLTRAKERGELVVNLLATLMALNRGAEAEALAADWLKQNPTDGAVHYYLAERLIQIGSYERAEFHLRRALQQRPDYPQALNNLAWALYKQGKPGAVEHAERALAVQPNQPAFLDTLAAALAAEKKFDRALESQRKAVEIAPSEPGYRLHLARIAIQAGQPATAKAELERLAALGSRFPDQAEVSRLLKSL